MEFLYSAKSNDGPKTFLQRVNRINVRHTSRKPSRREPPKLTIFCRSQPLSDFMNAKRLNTALEACANAKSWSTLKEAECQFLRDFLRFPDSQLVHERKFGPVDALGEMRSRYDLAEALLQILPPTVDDAADWPQTRTRVIDDDLLRLLSAMMFDSKGRFCWSRAFCSQALVKERERDDDGRTISEVRTAIRSLLLLTLHWVLHVEFRQQHFFDAFSPD